MSVISRFSRPYSSLATLRHMEKDMDRLFEAFSPASFLRSSFPALARRSPFSFSETAAPALDLYEKTDHYMVNAELPGLRKEDLKLELQNKTLSITGEHRSENQYHESEAHVQERVFGKFARKILLPEGAKLDQISAKFENGVLNIKIPKEEATPSQEIPIE